MVWKITVKKGCYFHGLELKKDVRLGLGRKRVSRRLEEAEVVIVTVDGVVGARVFRIRVVGTV